MESGRPTVVGPDGRRVVVPPGQVVYIRPPSGRNGSPGTHGAMIASVWHGNLFLHCTSSEMASCKQRPAFFA
jgi:hypothetical protein